MVDAFSTEQLPKDERFGSWQDLISSTLTPHCIRVDRASDFQARVKTVTVGDVNVSRLVHSPLEAWRAARHIRQNDPETFKIGWSLSGKVVTTQGRDSSVISAGELMMSDSSRPFHCVIDGLGGLHSGIVLSFPRTALRLPESQTRKLLLAPLSASSGIGRVLVASMTELLESASSYRDADLARLSTVSVDLVSALCAHYLDTDAELSGQAHQQVLLARIYAFMQDNLVNPDLRPDMIAAAHGISTRHLHRIFQTEGVSVAEWIRKHRLECCRRDLTDAALARRPVYAIGVRYGFSDSAHFSRVFRSRYGASPEAYRRQHLAARALH